MMGWLDTRAEAIREARKVRATYKLRGWEIYVHENMGWHAKLISPNGLWTITWGNYRGKIQFFHAWLKERGACGAIPGWVQDGKSPYLAIKAVQARMVEEVKRLERELEIAVSDPFEKVKKRGKRRGVR